MIATALPVAYLSIKGCYEYFRSDLLRALSLGVLSSDQPAPLPGIHSLPALLQRPLAARLTQQGVARRQPQAGYLALQVAPYVYHWALLTAVALLVMNVQVATRYILGGRHGHGPGCFLQCTSEPLPGHAAVSPLEN